MAEAGVPREGGRSAPDLDARSAAPLARCAGRRVTPLARSDDAASVAPAGREAGFQDDPQNDEPCQIITAPRTLNRVLPKWAAVAFPTAQIVQTHSESLDGLEPPRGA
jgi:hypothetical protein